jgi:hypothetical protein
MRLSDTTGIAAQALSHQPAAGLGRNEGEHGKNKQFDNLQRLIDAKAVNRRKQKICRANSARD